MMQGLLDSLTRRDRTGDWASPKPPAGESRNLLPRSHSSSPPKFDSLNRALVTGLVLEAMLENPRLQEEPGFQGHRLKACLRSTLACQLAGHMSLASFHCLAQGLDQWFAVVYPLLANAGWAHKAAAPAPLSGSSAETNFLEEELFSECLAKTPGLLPQRRHRKLDQEKLCNFLEGTGGNWFCLRDFEAHFQVGRKTAWEYVQKLLQAGLLVHNEGHSSAVRYRIASRFLKPGWVPASADDVKLQPDHQPQAEWRLPEYVPES
jgi:hypothetical protein